MNDLQCEVTKNDRAGKNARFSVIFKEYIQGLAQWQAQPHGQSTM